MALLQEIKWVVGKLIYYSVAYKMRIQAGCYKKLAVKEKSTRNLSAEYQFSEIKKPGVKPGIINKYYFLFLIANAPKPLMAAAA